MSEMASAVMVSPRAGKQKKVDLGTIKVAFENGNPCRPRYENLYHYPKEKAQVEPSFQIEETVEEVFVRLELKDPAVEFVEEGGTPQCRELGHLEPDPTVTIEYGSTPNSCKLTWKTAKKTLKVFRIYCKPTIDTFTDEHRVHGGIFLVFSTHQTQKMEPIKPESHKHEDQKRIHVLGTDEHHRPVYDIHRTYVVPGQIEIEPAYRIRTQEGPLSFKMIMKIQNAKWRPKPFFPLGEEPEELSYSLDSKTKTIFSFKWKVRSQETRIATFLLVPELATEASPLPEELAEWGSWRRYAEALAKVGIDPTIIQPPVCDPVYNVCAP